MTPLYVAELFAPLHEELMQMLSRLNGEQWLRPTVAPAWRVRDVAAHLLDGMLRKLSAHRDGHMLAPDAPLSGYRDVVALINSLNASGVNYSARLSHRLLVDLLTMSGRWCAEFVEQLDPHADALFAVAWAGEDRSENWMDTGREYTEWWHHQMQIRAAVDAPPLLLERRWLEPLLDFSMRALPWAFREVVAPRDATLCIEIDGDLSWSLRKEEEWRLWRGAAENATTTILMSGDVAWRLLYNALEPSEALRTAVIEGDTKLAVPLFAARSVMV